MKKILLLITLLAIGKTASSAPLLSSSLLEELKESQSFIDCLASMKNGGDGETSACRAAMNTFRRALETAKLENTGENIQNFLSIAITLGNLDAIKLLINEKNINSPTLGTQNLTPLILAISWGQVASIKAIVESGAQITNEIKLDAVKAANEKKSECKNDQCRDLYNRIIDYVLGLPNTKKETTSKSSK